MRALRDMNKPKFIFEDEPLFIGLIKDLFPGLPVDDRVGLEGLRQMVTEVFEDKSMKKVPEQIDKVIQLFETLHTRHTTMVVGPTSAGKSTIIKSLQLA